MAILECINLTVGYNDRTVLSDISFKLEPGKLAVLIGANGSGKSTLMRTLAGLKGCLNGNVEIGGEDISRLSERNLSRLRAMVNTARNGGGALTVSEAVGVGRNLSLSLFGGMSGDDLAAVADAMEAVGISMFANRYLATLSDGERQKVMIARALAQNTPLIFLDEPTAFLDVASRIDTIKLLRNLSRKGRTILMSTHDIAPAMAMADFVIAVVKDEQKVYADDKERIIASGVLNKVFSGSGLNFDKSILDYR